MSIDKSFWKNKNVLITGHTGFKGGWLLVFLESLEANVLGVSLEAEEKSFYKEANLQESSKGVLQDIRDLNKMIEIERNFKPEILFHLAAQPLVIESYKDPITTFTTNIIGTANILEIIRLSSSIKSGVIVTTDKCYENKNLSRGYKEDDSMGGHDPYSSSKGSAELITSSYQRSFFTKENFLNGSAAIGSVRAGNVIGGGDWGKDRLIPDLVASAESKTEVIIRNPTATRPWQHVLEAVGGYLCLAINLKFKKNLHGQSFNFGPNISKEYSVLKLVKTMSKQWKNVSWEKAPLSTKKFYESELLRLNCNKAEKVLKWKNILEFEETIEMVTSWYRSFYYNPDNINQITKKQIKKYQTLAVERGCSWARLF